MCNYYYYYYYYYYCIIIIITIIIIIIIIIINIIIIACVDLSPSLQDAPAQSKINLSALTLIGTTLT